MNVWTYWEGPLWDHIEVCLQTIAKQCKGHSEYIHVTPQNLHHYLPPTLLNSRWKTLKSPALRCDCIRAALLHRYGGLYVDCDTVMLKPPHTAIPANVSCAYVVWPTPPDRVLNGYIYCQANSEVTQYWIAGINERLSSGKVNWCDLGERTLTPIIRSLPDGGAVELPLATWLPVELDRHTPVFFTGSDWKSFLRPETVAFGLSHSFMTVRRSEVMQLPKEQWKSSKVMVHQLLAHALEIVDETSRDHCLC